MSVHLLLAAGLTSALPLILAAIVTIGGSGGIVFGALRYNRDEAGRIVEQQTSVLTDMRSLNTELQGALNRTREERDELRGEVKACREEIAKLEGKIDVLQKTLEQIGHGIA